MSVLPELGRPAEKFARTDQCLHTHFDSKQRLSQCFRFYKSFGKVGSNDTVG